jgi:hypothetical protein
VPGLACTDAGELLLLVDVLATQIVDFCNHYTQLLGMGFGPSLAAGALVKTKNDLSAATDLCLSLNA